MLTSSSFEWVTVLRVTPIVLGLLLLFSLVDFGLAVTYAKQLYNAPLDESKSNYSKDRHWSTAWFVFYSGFFPLVSCIHATIDVALFFFVQLNPICTLTVSFLLFVGWIIQISFWCHCDYAPDSNTCYQFYVIGNARSDMSGSLKGVSDNVTAAKVLLGVIMFVFYVAYLVMAATAVQETRRSERVGRDDDEEQRLEDRHPMACVIPPDRRYLLPS